MNHTTWQRAKEIFDKARSLADPEAFLDQACAGDAELRAEVEKLISSYDSGFLEETAMQQAEILLDRPTMTGQTIGRYVVGVKIGTGGMGEVYIADDTELDRKVAFKVLHRDIAEDSERVRRFIQEARAASALNHPNILTIHEIGSFEGSRFIVSEFVDGETLREKLRHGSTVDECLDVACQIAAALAAAHSAGIVHRDIKPENAMIRSDGLVKVLDFGLAKLTEADDRPIDADAKAKSPVHTNPGLVMGTVAYMSPEQARGQAVDARTDLWSLGVILHEMLAGSSPFQGDTETEILCSILKTETNVPITESLPEELRPICRKILTKERDQRYQSAHDLLNDLKGERKRMEYANSSTPYVTVSSTDEFKTQLIRPRPTLSAEYIVEGVKRHKYATFATVLFVVVAAIGFSVYKYNGATPPSPQENVAGINDSTIESDLKFSKLPISEQVRDIVISPDGKYVAYMPSKGIRLLELETSSDTEVSNEENIWGLRFSPDSQYVYYSFGNEQNRTEGIKRLSIRGGASVKVLNDPLDGVSFSRDGATMVFTRELRDGTAIVLANPDGSNERTLANTRRVVNVPLFSPDDKTIACQMEVKDESGSFYKIIEIDVTDGKQRVLSDKKWNAAWGAVWLAGGSIIINAREKVSDPAHLWMIPPVGEPKALTTGLINYRGLSATRNGDVLLSIQSTGTSNLWVLPANDANKAQQLTTTDEIQGRFVWTPDERIIFGSNVAGNADIWVMNANGGARKQLTNDPAQDVQPAVSLDGKYIAFTSNRVNGVNHLYLMNIDGSDLRQLTTGTGEILPSFSVDGNWIYFIGAQDPQTQIWKVSLNGGEPVLVTAAPDGWVLNGLDVNRADGRLLYGLDRSTDTRQNKIGILPVRGEAKLFDLPANLRSTRPKWAPDNRSVGLISRVGGGLSSDVWSMSVDGKNKVRQLTNFRTPGTYGFSWSFDGRKLLLSRGTSTNYPVLIRNTGN